MSTLLRFGDPLPLALVLPDGNTGKFPQAEIYQPGSATPLTTVDLAHLANGVYVVTGQTMPDFDYVLVLFITYNDAGHTIESSTHTRASETYVQSTFLREDDSVDGAITVKDALANANAMARGKITRIGTNQYAYRDSADGATLFTNEDNESERTPV